MKCRHPFLDRESLLILAKYITLDTGTGSVHTAPGHGQEDYESGLEYNLPIYSPVDDQGRFTPEVTVFRRAVCFRCQRRRHPKAREVGALSSQRDLHPSIPQLLALQEPHHLPGHGAVVHLHGEERIAPESSGGHRPSDLDSPLGP